MTKFIFAFGVLFLFQSNLFPNNIVELFDSKNSYDKQIKDLRSPFEIPIKKYSVKKSKKMTLNLEAIVNNRVKIDGKWYGINDKIHSFTISAIKDNRVYLKSKDTVRVIKFRKAKKLYISLK
jgi:hypothetical protein